MEKPSPSSQESTNRADKSLDTNDKDEKNKARSRSSSPIVPRPISSTARCKTVPLSGKPYFTVIIGKSHVQSPFHMVLPRSIHSLLPSAQVHGVLSYQNKNWKVTYCGDRATRYICKGWRKFAVDNNLKIGDACVLEVVDTLNLKFQVQILSGEIPPEATNSALYTEMGRSPCCSEVGVKKGPWMPEEDKKLVDYISKHGQGNWRQLPKLAGLNRCGKSCRLRWTNYLRPDIKRGSFSKEEEQLIIHLHSVLGNKWSMIAARLEGRTDNEIKNHWNTHLRKKLLQIGIDPVTHRPRIDLSTILTSLAALPNLSNLRSSWDGALRLQADASYLARLQLLQGLLQTIATSSPNMDVMSHFGSESAFANHQYNELQQLNNQFELVSNSSLGVLEDPTVASGYPAFRDMIPNNFQAFTESSQSLDVGCSGEHGVGGNSSSRNASDRNPTPNSVPSLISASPEDITTDQAQGLINSNATSVPYCDGLVNLANLDDDISWKDILEEISWSDDL